MSKEKLTKEQFITKFIQQCNEEFIKEHPMDAVDICIVDNYTDYIIERLSILFGLISRGDGNT